MVTNYNKQNVKSRPYFNDQHRTILVSLANLIKVIDFASKDYQFPMKTDIFSVDFLEYTSLSKCFGLVISNKVSVFEGNRAQMTSNKSTKDQYN